MPPLDRVLAPVLLAALCAPAVAQEADAGFTLPVTLTGQALYSHRLQSTDSSAAPATAAFHAVLYPSLKLGPHWFVYSSIHLSSTPFYYADAYDASHNLETNVVQAFLGYTRTYKSTSFLIKAGQLSTAFGSFPLHYDDAENPLIDQPLPYSAYLKLRPDQLPCNVDDLLDPRQYGTSANFHCGGSSGEGEGLTPATLYGLPAVEADISTHKLDARLQLTNSSPSNPQRLWSNSQHAQWTVGAGYTLAPGFRLGFSAFRGTYLDRAVAPFLPPGKNLGDFPATGAGLDAQWARGRWRTSGEWQWFRFAYPSFRVSPAVSFAYAEVKMVVNPRTYLAVRAAYQRANRVADLTETSQLTFAPPMQTYEFAIGFRPNRWQLLKLGYECLKSPDISGTRDNVLALQLVTSITPISKALR